MTNPAGWGSMNPSIINTWNCNVILSTGWAKTRRIAKQSRKGLPSQKYQYKTRESQNARCKTFQYWDMWCRPIPNLTDPGEKSKNSVGYVMPHYAQTHRCWRKCENTTWELTRWTRPKKCLAAKNREIFPIFLNNLCWHNRSPGEKSKTLNMHFGSSRDGPDQKCLATRNHKFFPIFLKRSFST